MLLVDHARRRHAARLVGHVAGDDVQHDDLAPRLAEGIVGLTHRLGARGTALQRDQHTLEPGRLAHARPEDQHRVHAGSQHGVGDVPDAGMLSRPQAHGDHVHVGCAPCLEQLLGRVAVGHHDVGPLAQRGRHRRGRIVAALDHFDDAHVPAAGLGEGIGGGEQLEPEPTSVECDEHGHLFSLIQAPEGRR